MSLFSGSADPSIEGGILEFGQRFLGQLLSRLSNAQQLLVEGCKISGVPSSWSHTGPMQLSQVRGFIQLKTNLEARCDAFIVSDVVRSFSHTYIEEDVEEQEQTPTCVREANGGFRKCGTERAKEREREEEKRVSKGEGERARAQSRR
ncbi:hypothetical protein Mapa_012681 [Marchantia paleacea]|nr:hypothetical protein Mapa_012681 [Marchantia paleacea]